MEVIDTARELGDGAVLTAAWSNGRTVEKVALESGSRVVELPTMVDGDPRATDWIAMMDLLHERVAWGLGVELPDGVLSTPDDG